MEEEASRFLLDLVESKLIRKVKRSFFKLVSRDHLSPNRNTTLTCEKAESNHLIRHCHHHDCC